MFFFLITFGVACICVARFCAGVMFGYLVKSQNHHTHSGPGLGVNSTGITFDDSNGRGNKFDGVKFEQQEKKEEE